jgi:hypothetical protein
MVEQKLFPSYIKFIHRNESWCLGLKDRAQEEGVHKNRTPILHATVL